MVNHQILLTTLSSLDITGIPLRWFESYLTGRYFRVAWGGEVSKAHQLVTEVPQGLVLGPLLFSTYTTSLAPIIQAHGFSYLLLLVFPATPTLQHDFTIQLGSSTITPSTLVRNLGVIFDDQLTFKDHIAKTARSYQFALHNIRKIRPFLTEHAAQLLVQTLVISRLDYCNALLAGLPSNTIKPLQIIQNAATRLVFSEPKRSNVTSLFISLHWLPVAARIKFKTLMLAYRTTTGSAPTYFHSLMTIYIPLKKSEICGRVSPHGAITERHKITLKKVLIHCSWLVEWTSIPIRNAESLTISSNTILTWLHLKKIKTKLPYLCSLSLNLSLSG